MIPLLVVIFQLIACVGFGALILKLIGITRQKPAREHLVYAFVLGMGLIGWLVFFVGISANLNHFAFSSVLGIGVILAVYLRSGISITMARPKGLAPTLLFLLLAVVALMDLFEALTPTGDADTLAYHFALPKQFLVAGRIEFVPRALDGAVSLLVQMTYMPVLRLGGEMALMLWVFASGWVLVYAVYVMARRHLDGNWSLIVALVFATTPAIVYGAGTGQVETRNALFVVSAVLALTPRKQENALTWCFLAGLFAGFFVGGKYLGILFAAVGGIAVLWEKRRLGGGIVYGLGVLVAGSQWYVWNAVHIGDPVFPMFFEWLGKPDTPYWSAAHQEYLRNDYIPLFKKVPSDLFWAFVYPLKATLLGNQVFASERTGFGPVILLLLPFAMTAVWLFRSSIRRGPLLTYSLIVLLFYLIWFFSDSPQAVRLLLPIYPLLLVLVFVAAAKIADRPFVLKPLYLAVAVAVMVQMGGQTLHSLKAVKFIFGQETRQQFLLRTVANFEPALWINENLAASSKVFMVLRHYLYYLDVPYFYAHATQQAQVNLLPSATDPVQFIRQIRSLGISHLLLPELKQSAPSGYALLAAAALLAGCLSPEKSFSTISIQSRTLPTLGRSRSMLVLYRATYSDCRKFP